MPETEVRLKITSDASAAVSGLDQVRASAKKMESETATLMGRMKQHWLAVSATVAAAGFALSKAFSLMEAGAKDMQAEEGFRNAAAEMSVDADKMIADLRRVTNETVETGDLMQKAMKGMSAGMDAETIVRIAEIARTAARRMGTDVKEAWSDIMDAVETGRTKSLVAYGLLTKEQAKLAEAVKSAGEEVDLFGIISANAAIHTATLGATTETVTERFQQMKTAVAELGQDIGRVLITAFAHAAAAILDVADRIIAPFAAIERVLQRLPGYKGSAWTDAQKYLRDKIAKLTGEAGAAAAAPPAPGSADEGRKAADAWMKKYQDILAAQKAKAAAEDMASAQLQWKKTIDALNPALDEEARRLGQLADQAEILRQKWGNQAWIDEGLTRAEEYLRATRDLKDATEDLRVAMERRDAVARASREIGTAAIASEFAIEQMKLTYARQAIEYGARHGTVSEAAAASASYELQLRALTLKEEEIQRQIELNSQLAVTGEEENDTVRLLMQQKAVQEEINQLLALRSAILREHTGSYSEGAQAGWNSYMNQFSDFRNGERFAQDMARMMHSTFEEFFFDPMKFSWEKLFTDLRRIVARAMADMVMNWIKSIGQMESSGQSCFSGLFSPLMRLFGLGGTGAPAGYSMQPGYGFDLLYHAGGPVRKMHRGGLMADEVPAILQTGEYVLSRSDLARLKSAGTGSGPVVVNINATDAQSFANLLRANPNAIADAISAATAARRPMRRPR